MIKNLKLAMAFLVAFAFSFAIASAAANFQVTSFSCSPSESVINSVFSCTAQVKNNGDAAGSVNTATLYSDSNNWLEQASYPQSSGTSVSPGQTTEITFAGLRAVKSGNNGFSKIMLDNTADNYVANNNIKVNVIDVLVTVSNSASSARMNVNFDSTAEVTAGGDIDVLLTFTVDSGGCSIGSQQSQKTIIGLHNLNKQSRTWTVTQGTSGNCKYTISAAATGVGALASKTDSTSSSVSCTNCPTESAGAGAAGAGGGAGGGATVVYVLGELTSEQSFELSQNERVKFNISGVEHSLTLKNLSDTHATISIESKAQTFIFGVGEEKSIDLNEDGVSEISVKLKSINVLTKKATFSIIPKVVAVTKEEKEVLPSPEEEAKAGVINFFQQNKALLIIIGVVIVVALVIVVYKIKKK